MIFDIDHFEKGVICHLESGQASPAFKAWAASCMLNAYEGNDVNDDVDQEIEDVMLARRLAANASSSFFGKQLDTLPELTPEMRAKMESIPDDIVEQLWNKSPRS